MSQPLLHLGLKDGMPACRQLFPLSQALILPAIATESQTRHLGIRGTNMTEPIYRARARHQVRNDQIPQTNRSGARGSDPNRECTHKPKAGLEDASLLSVAGNIVCRHINSEQTWSKWSDSKPRLESRSPSEPPSGSPEAGAEVRRARSVQAKEV